MAAITGINRTIIIPYGGGDTGSVNEAQILSAVATLVATPLNTLIASLKWSYIQFYTFSAGVWVFGRGVQIDLLLTVTGDVNVVANIPTFNATITADGYGTPVTWSSTISFGT